MLVVPTASAQTQPAVASLTIGSLVAPTGLDPTVTDSQAVDEVFDNNVYEHLVTLNRAGNVVGSLATGWTVSTDRTTYVFTLRPGVTFSNGDPLDPKAVVYSLLRAAAPASRYPDAYLLGDLEAVAAAGADKVSVTLAQPSFSFLHTLAATSDGIVVDPRGVRTMSTAPVGTGPYLVDHWVPGKTLTLVQNPLYWGTPPSLGRITFDYFTTPASENLALLAGKIQMIDDEAAPGYLAGYRADPLYRVVTGQTQRIMQLTLNNSVSPFDQLQVREAIGYATNRSAIDKVVTGGSALALGAPAVTADPWYVDLTATRPYDLAKARQLLAAAGYASGFAVSMTVPAILQDQSTASLLAAQLGQVGIQVHIVVVSYGTWQKMVVERGRFSMTVSEATGARQLQQYGNTAAYFQPGDALAVGAVMASGDSASSQAQFVALYKTALVAVSADAVNDWIYQVPEIVVAQSDVTGIPTSELSDSLPLADLGLSVPASGASSSSTTAER